MIDGSVECWGDNSSGQLGNNSTTSSPVPVPIVSAIPVDGGVDAADVDAAPDAAAPVDAAVSDVVEEPICLCQPGSSTEMSPMCEGYPVPPATATIEILDNMGNIFNMESVPPECACFPTCECILSSPLFQNLCEDNSFVGPGQLTCGTASYNWAFPLSCNNN
jgi:hypothetical protein